ncbi:YfjI family protein [Actinoalloteichus sp. GBA129-24]|uniref:YfjI family protein n=1 Tax=Actinoalloteichus sp. GBA129-24 TaxID=1612551 RepID=UPI0009507AA7|nr:YfjI family protein [Actinoalloteichus sp. GBA129-24]APU20145.1 putative DUF3987 family protein [Actinoalloteichus sp. GBA129-24]
MMPHRHVVMMSGGIGSWATAARVIAEHGREHVTLLFADTRSEDEDLYRFLDDAAAGFGVPITRVADGRTPQEVFRDVRWIGNSRVAPCSHLLKQVPCRQWLETNTDPADTTLYVGVDWSEIHRLPAIEAGWSPWTVRAPLTEPPYTDKAGLMLEAEATGLRLPGLYSLGFPHNNCAGSCVRGGQAQWALLHQTNPSLFDSWADFEHDMQDVVAGDQPRTILREQRDGQRIPLPLTVLRARLDTDQYDRDEWGGCGCFTEPPEQTGDPTMTPTGADAPHPDPPTTSTAAQAAGWEEPIALDTVRGLPVFPVTALPSWVADFVAAVAVETQTPPDLGGCVALACLSTAAGGRAEVVARGSWREPVNIFTLVALPPGARKSAVFRALTSPLRTAQTLLIERSRVAIAEAVTARSVAVREAEALARSASSDDPETVARAAEATASADAIRVPVEPRLIAGDITPEVASTVLADQGGRLAVLSAEGQIIANLAGRYSGKPNFELFLQGHAGDSLEIDRRDRKEFVDKPALTLGLAVQPAVIRDLAAISGADDKGLTARILYSLPADNVGFRQVRPPVAPPETAQAYQSVLCRLVFDLAAWDEPALLQLSPEADEFLAELETTTETALAPDGAWRGMRGWASKYVGAVLRIAGLLHLADHAAHDDTDAWRVPISLDTLTSAACLGEYYAAHAKGAFDLMGADTDLEAARTLLDWITRTRPASFTKRQAHIANRGTFPRAADLDAPLALLEEYGHLHQASAPATPGRGRPPSPTYWTHPTHREGPTESTEITQIPA